MTPAEAVAGAGVGATGRAGKSAGAGLALSLRQPWAALVAAGLKTVEVRAWATGYRGPVLIHAARQADPAADAWAQLPEGLWALAERRGGLVGAGVLAGCVTYAGEEAFAADRERHRAGANPWGVWPVYGLVLAEAGPVPFVPVRGRRGFFAVAVADVRPPVQGLLPFA